MYIEDLTKLKKLFRGVDIQPGAKLTETCVIEPGCVIGSEADLTAVQLQKNTRIFGEVRLEQGVVVHENGTLVGPLIIRKNAILATGVKIGVRMSGAEDRALMTMIGERALIGKNAEILGGVVVSQFCCVRANSLVIGDVPDYGLVGGSPAFLENLVCPQCGGLLKTVRRTGLATVPSRKVACSRCGSNQRRQSATP